MAVSGRKIDEFKDTVSLGSAEDFDHRCDPCLTDNQQVEAHGFCVDCQEYLCKSCFKFHQKTKALRNHQLLDKDNLSKAGTSAAVSEICTEKCSTHRNEVIKFFCPKHEDIGCTDCMTMHHRACDLDYIPDKCANIGDSGEYREIMEKMDQKMKEIDEIMKSATERDNEVDTCHDNIIKEVIKFRQEISSRLDQLQKEVVNDVTKIKSAGKEIIQHVVEVCTRVSVDIKTLQSRIKDSKAVRQNGQLYIDIKRAKSKLKSKEIRAAEESLEKSHVHYTFERNKNLENSILAKETIFGKLSLPTVTQSKKDASIKLLLKDEINIKTKTDVSFFKCCISGCTALPSKKIVVVDNSKNKKVKVVDVPNMAVIDEKALDSEPFDVVALPEDRIAVSIPDAREVLIMSLADTLSVIRRIPVKGVCKGITCHKGTIFVLCNKPSCVLLMDPRGNVKQTVSLNDAMFKQPRYIVVSEDSKCIYISEADSVKCVTLQGEMSAEYQMEQNSSPKGMTVLADGSLLMCCLVKEKILHVSGDLKQSQELAQNIYGVQSICCNRQTGEVYVGGYSCNSLKVFTQE